MAGDEPVEVEVKLAVADPPAIRVLVRDPDPARLAGFAAAGAVEVRRVTDRYIDTAVEGGRLEAAGCRARLRTVRRRTELTVKRDDVRRGPINTRVELVGPATRALDSRRWPTSGARDELIRLAGQASFEVVATLHQRREIRRLSRGGTVVELSLDELRAGAAGRSAPRRWELEAELVRGDRHALGELGAALQAVPGVGEPLGTKLAFARAAAPRDA